MSFAEIRYMQPEESKPLKSTELIKSSSATGSLTKTISKIDQKSPSKSNITAPSYIQIQLAKED
jgi:hypothetical protein